MTSIATTFSYPIRQCIGVKGNVLLIHVKEKNERDIEVHRQSDASHA